MSEFRCGKCDRTVWSVGAAETHENDHAGHEMFEQETPNV